MGGKKTMNEYFATALAVLFLLIILWVGTWLLTSGIQRLWDWLDERNLL